MDQKFVFICKCGAEVELGKERGWLIRTQPSVATCPKCLLANAISKNVYDEDYFLRGKETGKSLYDNYRWMPDLTRSMVRAIADHLRTGYKTRVLDFGCARGYVVRAFREMGYQAWGIDVSEWAIKNCDPMISGYVNWTDNSPPLLEKEFDWIIAKDVLEHVPSLDKTIGHLLDAAKVGMFVVVPLSSADNMRYVVSDYEEDITHLHRFTLGTWASMFIRPGWSVDARYRLKGVKDNYSQYPNGNGFITCRRLDS